MGEWERGEWRGGSGGVGLESRPRQLSKEYFPHTQLEESPLHIYILIMYCGYLHVHVSTILASYTTILASYVHVWLLVSI